MKRITHLLMALGLAVLPVAAEEFSWSWEQDKAGGKPGEAAAAKAAPKAAEPAPAAAPKEPFDWSWEKAGDSNAAAPAAGILSPGPRGGVGTEAYNELVKENLSLRKQIEQATGVQDSVRKENERLAREVRDLDGPIQEFAKRVEDLKKAQGTTAPADAGQQAALEAQLATAQQEKQRLTQELATLKDSGAPKAAIQPGSDLYRQLEKENADLKEQLAATQAEKQTAVAQGAQVSDSESQLRAQLAQSQAKEQRYRELLAKVMQQLPELERNLSGASSHLRGKDADLDARAREMETMKAELEVRERRLLKAERILALLAKTRLDVTLARDLEERDIHYNMALLHAKAGRYPAAEDEYLRALRLDPSDANTHYNLAVLYDDALKNRRRAAMHYRKYLALSPHAEDVDQVRQWLMRAEVE